MSVEEQRTGELNDHSTVAGTELLATTHQAEVPAEVVAADAQSAISKPAEEAVISAASKATEAKAAIVDVPSAQASNKVATPATPSQAQAKDDSGVPPQVEQLEAFFDYRKGHSRLE